MNDLRMYILTWVKFKCAGFLATLMKAVLAVVKPLRSRFCGYRLQKGFNIPRVLIDKPHLEFCKYLNWKQFYIILGLLRWFYDNQYFVNFEKIVCFLHWAGAHLKFTHVKIYISRSFIFHPIPMKFWLKTPNNIYKNWLNSHIDRLMFTV